jgi:P27 family predicted phage terminase small subunit
MRSQFESSENSGEVAQIPPAPGHLDEIAKEKWHEVCAELIELGVLRKGNFALVAMYCDCWSRWIECTDMARKEGYVLTGEQGGTYQNPTLCVANKALEHCNRIANALGLTPTSQPKLPNGGKKGASKLRIVARKRA